MSRRTKRTEKGTQLGTELSTWDLWIAMSDTAKVFWLMLYTSGHARGRCPIGLWKGSTTVMAEEWGRDVDQVLTVLRELERLGAVEFDRSTQVLRLVRLPDRCERPPNGDVLRGWWNKFICLPRCMARDLHVATIRWLIGEFTPDHQEAWDETFGQVEAVLASAGHGVAHGVGHGVPHGVGHRQGEGEGEGEGILISPEIVHGRPDVARARDPVEPPPPAPRPPPTTVPELWAAAIAQLEGRVSAQNLDMWLRPFEPVALEGASLSIRAPNSYVRGWFEANYLALVQAELRAITGVDLVVHVAVEPAAAAAGVEDLADRALTRFGPKASGGGRR